MFLVLMLSPYVNSRTLFQNHHMKILSTLSHFITQIVFERNFIPCPNDRSIDIQKLCMLVGKFYDQRKA